MEVSKENISIDYKLDEKNGLDILKEVLIINGMETYGQL